MSTALDNSELLAAMQTMTLTNLPSCSNLSEAPANGVESSAENHLVLHAASTSMLPTTNSLSSHQSVERTDIEKPPLSHLASPSTSMKVLPSHSCQSHLPVKPITVEELPSSPVLRSSLVFKIHPDHGKPQWRLEQKALGLLSFEDDLELEDQAFEESEAKKRRKNDEKDEKRRASFKSFLMYFPEASARERHRKYGRVGRRM
ncbi:hypothetical protein BU16DRAFT_528257 [Lophium mytilinum]|uniref:Uncharacterized protein n=1 Tax=Lophium mytilinum TaxID=390894 RepID=A0A6A6QT64_9PEZI|nr:hypothetical protein BU16DRAFT_528257 [Lophium mytilinum]